MQDIMITYCRKTRLFRFYADGREIKVEGDMAIERVFLLLKNAVEEGKHEYDSS